jgi:hypothetical protein
VPLIGEARSRLAKYDVNAGQIVDLNRKKKRQGGWSIFYTCSVCKHGVVQRPNASGNAVCVCVCVTFVGFGRQGERSNVPFHRPRCGYQMLRRHTIVAKRGTYRQTTVRDEEIIAGVTRLYTPKLMFRDRGDPSAVDKR